MKLLKILLSTYKYEYKLNLKEGLIKTTELGKTVSILKKQFPDWLFASNTDGFNIYLENCTKEQLDKLIQLTNNLGWFPSYIRSDSYTGKYNYKIFEKSFKTGNTVECNVEFEAKYDFVIEKIPTLLYHVTPKQNLDKIKQVGLIPKSRSKASYHPERVYLTKNISDCKKLTNMFYKKTGIKEWSIIEIDTSKIPGDYFRLYEDPNFRTRGYYTLNNIPPISIEEVDEVNF